MSNLTDPIKIGLGRYLAGFHAQIIADTAGVQAWAARQFSKAAAFVPDRMVDEAEKMLETWRKNDTPKPLLPMLLVAVAKDFTPTPAEFTRNNGDLVYVMIPSDPLSRVFKMRTVSMQLRCQILIAAADSPTAKSLAMQLHAHLSSLSNRRFGATYRLAGFHDEQWPVQIETPEILMPSVATEQTNLTMLLAELTLYATVPMLVAPKSTEPNDGKGSGPNQDNPFEPDYAPNGYLVVNEAAITRWPPLGTVPDVEWTVHG